MRTELGEETRRLVAKYKLQKWFIGEPRGRQYAWDIISFMNKNVKKDAAILEMGCGISQNLVELWRHGFQELYGTECDRPTLLAGYELLEHFNVDAVVRSENAKDELWLGEFDVIAPLNFTYRKEINMRSFLPYVRSMLNPGGLLIVDIISSDYPENKAPEYVNRFSEKGFLALASGFKLVEVWHNYYPRSVYVMEAR